MSLSKILNHHHAIFVEGEREETLNSVRNTLIDSGIEISGNPDVSFLTFEKFGIDESRQIIEVSLGAPISDQKKIIIISFSSITLDAQNALLKIFEDPASGLQFIINSDSSNGLLQTLKSRLHIIRRTHAENRGNDTEKNALLFIDMSLGDRMKAIEKIVKDYKDAGNKREIKKFLLALHSILEKRESKDLTALKAVGKALEYLDDKSSGVKILLESVALVA